MLDWEKPTAKFADADAESEPGKGPYPPPQRACLVCGQQKWLWDGQYRCGSDDPAHAEREGWPWISIGFLSID